LRKRRNLPSKMARKGANSGTIARAGAVLRPSWRAARASGAVLETDAPRGASAWRPSEGLAGLQPRPVPLGSRPQSRRDGILSLRLVDSTLGVRFKSRPQSRRDGIPRTLAPVLANRQTIGSVPMVAISRLMSRPQSRRDGIESSDATVLAASGELSRPQSRRDGVERRAT
jgi:hypothetical protein